MGRFWIIFGRILAGSRALISTTNCRRPNLDHELQTLENTATKVWKLKAISSTNWQPAFRRLISTTNCRHSRTFGPFWRILVILVAFGPFWRILVILGSFGDHFGSILGHIWEDFGRLTEEPQLGPELCSTPRLLTGPLPIPTTHPPHPAPRAPALRLCALRLAEIR